MSVWAPDLHNYSPHKAAAQLALFAGVFASVAGIVYNFYPESPVVKIANETKKKKKGNLTFSIGQENLSLQWID